jgi:type I restriction enzyme S subunit
MGLKPGYKQTEIGIIPADWDVDYVESIGHITTGNKNTQDRIEDGEYPFFVRSQIIERINTYSFDGEAVLTAGDGVGTGKVFHYINGKFDLHQRVYRISDFKPRVNGYFFYLYFSRNFYSRIMKMTAKSSVDSVRRDMISRMMVPMPTKEGEQEAISSAIRDVDALLDGLERLIAKKRDIKQAAMQQLLTGKTRLPGFEGEWEVKRLGDIAPLQRGFDLPNRLLRQGPYPVVYSNGVMNYHASYQVSGPGVVTGRSGTIGSVSFVEDNFWPHNTALWVTTFKESNPKFVYFLYGWVGLERFASGSGVPTLNRNDVHNLQIFVPLTVEEQTAIANVLSDMDAEIAALEHRYDKTKDIKQAMMQELLTGKTRLVMPEASKQTMEQA